MCLIPGSSGNRVSVETIGLLRSNALPRCTPSNTFSASYCEVRRWLSPHQGISKDKLTQYLRAFQYIESCTESRDETHSNTLSERHSEINNVLRMNDRPKRVAKAISEFDPSAWHSLVQEPLRTARTAVAQLPTRENAVIVFGIELADTGGCHRTLLTL